MPTYTLTRTIHPAGAEPYKQELTLEADNEAQLFDAYLELKLNAIPGEDGAAKPSDPEWIIECNADNPGGECVLAEDALTADYGDFTPAAKTQLRRYFNQYDICLPSSNALTKPR